MAVVVVMLLGHCYYHMKNYYLCCFEPQFVL